MTEPSIRGRVEGIDDPAGGGFADYFAQLQGAITFGEVFGVGERSLIGDQDGGEPQGALTEVRPGGRRRAPARSHGQVVLAREHVDGVLIDEAAVVISDIDDDAFPGLVLYVEIDIELVQRLRGHVGDVHIAEFPVADLVHIRPVGFDPGSVEQPFFRRKGDRTHDGFALLRRIAGCADFEDHAPIDLVLEQAHRDWFADRWIRHRPRAEFRQA